MWYGSDPWGGSPYTRYTRMCHLTGMVWRKIANGTQKDIFLCMGGWNSYNVVQAAQEDAQKSQNLLYHISLIQSHLKAHHNVGSTVLRKMMSNGEPS